MARLRYLLTDPAYFLIGRIRYLLTDPRTLLIIGVLIAGGLFMLGGATLKMIAFWIGIVLIVALVVLLTLWAIRRTRARRGSAQLGAELVRPSAIERAAGTPSNGDVDALRSRLREAVTTIKTSRLGQARGTQALYELPWYMIIGNPAAGKSTAIVNSGLRFPFADDRGSIVQGIGGTRNCDWYFTTEGILLDTAGRYAVQSENRSEWLSFLEMLRRNRPRAPINGILIAASIPELTGNRPEFSIELAKKLRQRVQEITDWLEVVPPVYVVFTKADLIDGFNDFFHPLDDSERQRVWGATLPFDPADRTALDSQFDRYFDELSEGLKEMGLSQMSPHRGSALAPGMLTLPLEFTSIKATLRTFIVTLFDDNPYQFRPVFRGFYFTSALQEAAPAPHASERIAQHYGLSPAVAVPAKTAQTGTRSYFLLDLFRRVIFADRHLVRQYSSRSRKHVRYAVWLGAALVLGLALAGWAWSYTSHRQLVTNVQADLNQVEAVQKSRIDLQSRLEALQILQNRLQQLQLYRHDHPLMQGLGLYRGNAIEHRVRAEYFNGMRQLMLNPVAHHLESYLKEVVSHASQPAQPSPANTRPAATHTPPGTYQPPSPTSTQDAYSALRAYLMLAHPRRVEPVQLADQLTRFWRSWLLDNRGRMTRDQLIGSADHLMGFYVTQYHEPGWPTLDPNAALVDDTRQELRSVMAGMSAIRRVYSEIKARAATRYPAISVPLVLSEPGGKLVLGSYSIPGTFTREAWQDYVLGAIRDAANHQLSTRSWVLQSTRHTDLTLSASPKQIQKQLELLYNHDYVQQWRRFLAGVSVAPFGSFSDAVNAMDTLGDPQNSPLRKLMDEVYQETSWDTPAPVVQGSKSSHGGLTDWFKRVILRRPSATTNAATTNSPGASPTGGNPPEYGPVGRAFSGVARLMVVRHDKPPPFQDYLAMLAKLRTRLDTIHNEGDPGPGALKLIQATLDGNGSGLSAGLRLIDGQMLDGLDADQRVTLRPLLLRPLVQTFSALVYPAEAEINKTWQDQVYTPFENNLAHKSPFDPDGQVQAVASEIAQIFGPTGAIAKFAGSTLGPLVNRRGNTITARQWAGMGVALSPKLMAAFAHWVAPLGQTVTSNGQTVFQIQPEPGSGGISEYTIDINGQTLRYRNTPPHWQSFVWDATHANPVAQVDAVTYDGRNVAIEHFSGSGALAQLFRVADGGLDQHTGIYTLTWKRDRIAVTVHLRLVSGAGTNANGSQKQGLTGITLPAAVVGSRATATQVSATTTEGKP